MSGSGREQEGAEGEVEREEGEEEQGTIAPATLCLDRH